MALLIYLERALVLFTQNSITRAAAEWQDFLLKGLGHYAPSTLFP